MALCSVNDCESTRAPVSVPVLSHFTVSAPQLAVLTLSEESHFTRKSFDPARARVPFVNLSRALLHVSTRETLDSLDWESPRRCTNDGTNLQIITHASGCSVVSVRASRVNVRSQPLSIEMVIVRDALGLTGTNQTSFPKRDEMLVPLLDKFSHTTLLCSRFAETPMAPQLCQRMSHYRVSSIRISDIIDAVVSDYGRYLTLTEFPLLPAETRQVRASSVRTEREQGDRID